MIIYFAGSMGLFKEGKLNLRNIKNILYSYYYIQENKRGEMKILTLLLKKFFNKEKDQ